jgi:hypothetical protein
MAQTGNLVKLNSHVVQLCCGNKEVFICTFAYYVLVSNYLGSRFSVRCSACLLYPGIPCVALCLLVYFDSFLHVLVFSQSPGVAGNTTHLGCA